jgi:hypothetical protein
MLIDAAALFDHGDSDNDSGDEGENGDESEMPPSKRRMVWKEDDGFLTLGLEARLKGETEDDDAYEMGQGTFLPGKFKELDISDCDLDNETIMLRVPHSLHDVEKSFFNMVGIGTSHVTLGNFFIRNPRRFKASEAKRYPTREASEEEKGHEDVEVNHP